MNRIHRIIYVLVFFGLLALFIPIHPDPDRNISAKEINLTLTLHYQSSNDQAPTEVSNTRLFSHQEFILWNSDLHSSPITDVKHFLKPMGVEFIHYALDGRCQRFFNNCKSAAELDIDRDSILNMNESVISRFYKRYINDSELMSVKGFICFHPAPLCELFVPFNRSILIVASTRYAAGRPDARAWTAWNTRLRRLASSNRNLVAANNRYDVEYMRYYSGVEAELIPSYCGYVAAKYSGFKQNHFLLYAGRYPSTKHARFFRSEWNAACEIENCTAFDVTHKVDAFTEPATYDQIAAYQAIIHIPYQVSTMSLFEHYRMAIPLFFPSLDYLVELDMTRDFVNERNCKDLTVCYADKPFASISSDPTQSHIPDPHNKTNAAAARYWLQFSDFYQWPHITYFNSIADLIQKLHTTNFSAVSHQMEKYNHRVESAVTLKWRQVLTRIAGN